MSGAEAGEAADGAAGMGDGAAPAATAIIPFAIFAGRPDDSDESTSATDLVADDAVLTAATVAQPGGGGVREAAEPPSGAPARVLAARAALRSLAAHCHDLLRWSPAPRSPLTRRLAADRLRARHASLRLRSAENTVDRTCAALAAAVIPPVAEVAGQYLSRES